MSRPAPGEFPRSPSPEAGPAPRSPSPESPDSNLTAQQIFEQLVPRRDPSPSPPHTPTRPISPDRPPSPHTTTQPPPKMSKERSIPKIEPKLVGQKNYAQWILSIEQTLSSYEHEEETIWEIVTGEVKDPDSEAKGKSADAKVKQW